MKTILIVDDNLVMRNIVRNAFDLLKIPCTYLEADNGGRAFHLLETNSVDLVLLDWNMPEMDGIEFLKKVRSMPDYKTLPIVMITSEAAKYMVIEALQCGATNYIVKPFKEKLFMEKMLEINF